MSRLSLVSAIMPTANRAHFVPQAIKQFLAQDYSDKELIVFDNGRRAVDDIVPDDDPRIRYWRQETRQTLGEMRNLICASARGRIIIHWDDDDWSAPTRLSRQVKVIMRGADICGLANLALYDPVVDQAWEYQAPLENWVYGATLCYRKSVWRASPFAALETGEDERFVFDAMQKGAQLLVMHDDIDMFVGRVHAHNTYPKRTHLAQAYRPMPVKWISDIVGDLKVFATATGPLPAPIVRQSIMVSIIIPFLAGVSDPSLQAALRSAESQDIDHDSEIIICADADRMEEARTTIGSDIAVIESVGCGRAAAINTAIAHAKGQYLAFLEGYDWWHQEFLRYSLKALEDAEFVSSSHLEMDRTEVRGVNDYPILSSWVMRRRLYDEVGPFADDYPYHLDQEWLGRLGAATTAIKRRVHLVEATAPIDPTLQYLQRANLSLLTSQAQAVQLVRHPEAIPLVRHWVADDPVQYRISSSAEFRKASEDEYTRMIERFGRIPW